MAAKFTIQLDRPDHSRNEQKRALFHRAGNAGVAVTVDTRRKPLRARKGAGSYSRREKFGRDY